MKTTPRELRTYITPEGSCPFSEWQTSLKDIRTRARIDARLLRVKMGNLGDCKSVGEGVFEFRLDFGPGYRIYFAQDGEVIIMLLCGGSKKGQGRDIETAHAYWKEYRS